MGQSLEIPTEKTDSLNSSTITSALLHWKQDQT